MYKNTPYLYIQELFATLIANNEFHPNFTFGGDMNTPSLTDVVAACFGKSLKKSPTNTVWCRDWAAYENTMRIENIAVTMRNIYS